MAIRSPGPLFGVTISGLPILASGVITSGWSDGMSVSLGVTVDPATVGLVVAGHVSGSLYGDYGHLYLDSTTAFKVYYPSGAPGHPPYDRLPWAVLDLSRVLRSGETVQRARASLNRASTLAWTTKSITLGTALGDYANAYCNLPHFGRYTAGGTAPIHETYALFTNATTLVPNCLENTSGSTAAFNLSYEAWPLKA